MLDFVKWCESKNVKLPNVSENTRRTGARPYYPDAYVRAQYPGEAYFAPYTATAYLDLKNAKSGAFRSKKDVGETPVK